MEKVGPQPSWESSDANCLSGHQTIAAAASEERSQNCGQSGDLSSFDEQGIAGTSDAQPSRDGLDLLSSRSPSMPSSVQNSDAAPNESASGNISARKLREKLLSLRKEEQELGNKQWRATKLEMVCNISSQ
jgi:hypothetical protein